MTNTARTIALAGIIAGATLGLAGLAGIGNANATTTPQGPGYSYSPDTYATPAPNAQPGWHNHHGPTHIAILTGK